MTNWFLKAKHWQLFLLFFGLPIVAYIIFMIFIFGNLAFHQNSDPEFLFDYIMSFMSFFMVIGVISSGSQLWWQWAIAVGLKKKVPEDVILNVGRFKIFFWFPIVYFIIFFFIFFTVFREFIYYQTAPDPMFISGILVFVLPIHLFVVFCSFYVMYFVAKTFKTIELQKKTTFGDFAGEFFLVWFYMIGVWFIQPKVNSWVEE